MRNILVLIAYACLLLAKDIPLPEPAIVPSVYAQFDPEVATDGRDYLAVWSRDGVRGQRISASGELIDGEFVISDRPSDFAQIVWTGSTYLIVCEGFYARVSANGEVLQRDVDFAIRAFYTDGVSWNGRNVLFSWCAPLGRDFVSHVSLLNADLDRVLATIDIRMTAAVATSDGYLVFSGNKATPILNDGTVKPSVTVAGIISIGAAASNSSNILVAALDGTIVNLTNGSLHHVPGSGGSNITLTASANGFLFTSANEGGAFGVRLDSAGEAIDSVSFRISTVPYAGNFRGASNGDSYLLTWSDGRRTPFYLTQQVWGALIPVSRLSGLREFPMVFSRADQFAPNAIFNGAIGLVAWGETTVDEPSRVVAARFLADGSILDSRGIEIAATGIPSGIAS